MANVQAYSASGGVFRVEWTVPMSVLAAGWAKGREVFETELEFRLSQVAQRLQSYARSNHVWQNRTGDAENQFSVEMNWGDRMMVMQHGVPYGKYLEGMQGGRFAIIPATFTYGEPLVVEAMQAALDQAYGT